MQIDSLPSAVRIQSGFGIRIDGVNMSSHFGPDWSTTHDSEAAFASCSLPVLRPFTLGAGRHSIALYAGWQGDTSQPVFTGEITNKADTFYPARSTLTAGGYLKRTEVGLDIQLAFYYNGGSVSDTQALLDQIPASYGAVPIDTDAALIVHILETYGITPATTGHSIDASWWIPAKISPIFWDVGTSGWSIIQAIDRIADYRTADGRLGQVLRRQLFGSVPSSVRHTFIQGIDILDLHVSTEFEVYNQVKVTGAAIPSLVESDPDNAQVVALAPGTSPEPSSYIPDPPGVRTDDSLQSDYIETVEDAAEIAGRLLARLSEPLQDVILTSWGCPELDVGDGSGVSANALALSTRAFIIAHTVSGSPLRSELRLRAGTLGSSTRPNQPPTAQMLISVILERIIVAGQPTIAAMITIDARASSDSDGTIAAWSIALDATTYNGTDITTAVITHLSTSPSPVPITLTVTDNGGLSTTLTQQATWATNTALVEPLIVAEATQAEASVNGELSWNTLAASVTAVAPIALGGATCYGCSDGKVYRSTDMLATAPTLVQTLPAAVNCLWCNETATSRWLAGLDNGDLWLSIDDGMTWTKLHTFVAAVNDVAESPAQPGEMTICSGPSLWHTYDNGASWEALITGTGTALRFAAGHVAGQDQAFCGFDDGSVQSTAGVTFPLPTAAAIRGMTLSLDATELYIFTDSTTAYVWTPEGGIIAGPATGTATNRAIRSGSGQWVYVATDGALQKWIARQAAYDVRLMTSPQRALAVGYGSVGAPILPPPPPAMIEVLCGTDRTTPGGIWHYVPGAGWSLKNNGLPEGLMWRWVAASPLNPDHWLALGRGTGGGYEDRHPVLDGTVRMAGGDAFVQYSPLWITTDSGATWQEAPIQAPEAHWIEAIYSAEWSVTTPGRWYMPCFSTLAAKHSCVLSGDMLTPRSPWVDPDYWSRNEWTTVGPDDDVLVGHNDGSLESGVSYFRQTPTGMISVPWVGPEPEPLKPPEPAPDKLWIDLTGVVGGGRALGGVEGYRTPLFRNRFWYTKDYRLSPLKVVVYKDSFPGHLVSLAATTDAIYVASSEAGLIKVTNLSEYPDFYDATLETVEGTPELNPKFVVSDRQTKTALAATLSTGSNLLVFDNTTWQGLPLPQGVRVISRAIEVIVRGATP